MRGKLSGAVWVAGVLGAAVLTPAAGAQVVVRVSVSTAGLRTTVTVPDGGTAAVGGYDRLSEGRSEYGAPVAGRVPYAGRGFRNTGYGRSAVSRRVRASVRVINLREEEYRQTGFRSP